MAQVSRLLGVVAGELAVEAVLEAADEVAVQRCGEVEFAPVEDALKVDAQLADQEHRRRGEKRVTAVGG